MSPDKSNERMKNENNALQSLITRTTHYIIGAPNAYQTAQVAHTCARAHTHVHDIQERLEQGSDYNTHLVLRRR